MSEKNTVARPYARAIFEIAKTENQLEQWSQALKQLTLIVQNPTMVHLLKHPLFSVQQSVDLLFELMPDLTSKMKNAVVFIANEKRLLYLPEIVSLFEELKRAYEQVINVTLVLAAPATKPDFLGRIESSLQTLFEQKVNLQHEIDSSIIGGFIIKAEDRDWVIDRSFKGQLAQLSDALGV